MLFYKTSDLARMFQLNQKTIERKIRAGVIHGVKVGAQWVVSEAEVQRLQKEGFK